MRRKETARLTITAVFVALLLLQTFVPNIGYIRIIPALPAITTIPLTIAIYSSLMGPKAGLRFGLFWGITRLFVAYTQPGDIVSLLIFQNPVISLVPSIIAGWLPGLIVKVIKRKDIGFIFAGLVASLTNTFLVILLTSLFFMNNATVLTSHLGNNTGSNTLFIILVAALGLNGILEAIFTGIVTPIVAIPLRKAFVRLQL